MSNDTKSQLTGKVKWHEMSNDRKSQMTENLKGYEISMTLNLKLQEMSNDM